MAGIFDAIANPAQVDVLGSLDKGRERQGKDLAGRILGETFTGKLGMRALANLDPDRAIEVARVMEDELGVPVTDKGRQQHFVGNILSVNHLIQNGMVDEGMQLLSEGVSNLTAATNDSSQGSKTQEMLDRWEQGDQSVLQEIEALAGAFTQGSTKIGNVSPKDFTVESLATYEQSGSIGDLVRYTPQVKDIAGIPHQYNQESLRWEPLIDMTDKRISDQAKAAAGIEADKQSKLDFTEQQSKWQASESKLVTKLSSARSKHTILSDTAQEMRDMRSAWASQYGAALKGLPASQARKMAGLINTIKANSAFGTLADLKESGGTLGAISAPELVLLEAALGTLDQYGDNEEQMRVLDQILTANMSSIDRLDNAYIMDRKKYGTSFEEATTPISDEDLLNKYR